MKIFRNVLIGFAVFIAVVVVGFYFSTYHPAKMQKEKITSSADSPILQKGQKIKILSWNVQFMAGKNYVFFFDAWDSSGPDVRPSKENITMTFDEVVRVIKSENPDIILLQELDSASKRTDGEDQLKRLLTLLPAEYSNSCSAWYWKAAFVPHPQIMGSVGMKLAVISKYKMSNAIRYQLPLMPNNIVMRNLQFKRAMLEAVFPVNGSTSFSALSIHQDAFAQGSDTMQKQVDLVSKVLAQKDTALAPWVIGGDFNLIPPGSAYDRLPENEKMYFQKESEIAKLYASFNAYPKLEWLEGPDYAKYFTHWPNTGTAADRTIDYYFVGKNTVVNNYYVRSEDTTKISDHFPTIIEITLP